MKITIEHKQVEKQLEEALKDRVALEMQVEALTIALEFARMKTYLAQISDIAIERDAALAQVEALTEELANRMNYIKAANVIEMIKEISVLNAERDAALALAADRLVDAERWHAFALASVIEINGGSAQLFRALEQLVPNEIETCTLAEFNVWIDAARTAS